LAKGSWKTVGKRDFPGSILLPFKAKQGNVGNVVKDRKTKKGTKACLGLLSFSTAPTQSPWLCKSSSMHRYVRENRHNL